MPPKPACSSVAILLVCSLFGASSLAEEATSSNPGATKEQAIEVCKPAGEREYLARLVCPDSSHPTFARRGSEGLRHEFPADMSEKAQLQAFTGAMGFEKFEAGSTDHHMVDNYVVECGTEKTTLYFDMYHCDGPAPDIAPDGFTLIK